MDQNSPGYVPYTPAYDPNDDGPEEESCTEDCLGEDSPGVTPNDYDFYD